MTLIGQTIGHYRIESQLGKGGMGSVYRAYHDSLDRQVAIKFMAASLAGDNDFVQRFLREARLMAKLDHPNIVRVYDCGEWEGSPYLVMELLEGETLRERIERGGLTEAETIRIIKAVLQGLGRAHSQGIVHRDIKPANILLCRDGGVKVMDFGIAKAASEVRLTGTGMQMGTPQYMSPEQAEGNPVDHRSDLYSVGVMLYEMLTGRVPFNADTPFTILNMHISKAPPPLPPNVSPLLRDTALRSLAKRADDRFATAEQMVGFLEGKAPQVPGMTQTSAGGYTPPQGGYAPQQGGYAPPQGGGYAPPPTTANPPSYPQQGGYPPQGGYPSQPQATGYTPPPVYPPAQQGGSGGYGTPPAKKSSAPAIIGGLLAVAGVAAAIFFATKKPDSKPVNNGGNGVTSGPVTSGPGPGTDGPNTGGNKEPDDGWQTFNQGNFSVRAPASFREEPTSNPGTHLWVLDHNGLRYVAGYTDVGALGSSDPHSLLEGAKSGAVGNKRLIYEKEITQNGAPGKELSVEIPGQDGSALGVMNMRFIVKNDKLYNALITIPTGKEASSEQEKFLDSFSF